jgi:ferritin-like metal-binding protein YciE
MTTQTSGIFSTMAKTGTARELLIVALQDLNDGERAVTERLPAFADGVSAGLAGYLSEERDRAAAQSARLEQSLAGLGAPATDAPNIWLRANLDDAARDYRTIVPGDLRDIALVGAFRKAQQSARVSYETALGLAGTVGNPALADDLALCRDEEAAADAALARLLQALLARI